MKLNKLIVVDDSDADLLYTSIVLERAGVCESILAFGTGIEALEYLQREPAHAVDLVLLDINMPEMNGFEFLQAYERLCARRRARAVVVMLTSSPDPQDRARAESFACVRHFVVKPITVEQARQLVAIAAIRRPDDARDADTSVR